MKSEDGTGSRRPSWRCGNVTPPISFCIKGLVITRSFLLYLVEHERPISVKIKERYNKQACIPFFIFPSTRLIHVINILLYVYQS